MGETDDSQDREDQRQPEGHQAVDGSDDQAVGDLRHDERPVGHTVVLRVGQSEGNHQDAHGQERGEQDQPGVRLRSLDPEWNQPDRPQ